MALEIANLVQAALSFTATNPPVILHSDGFVESSLARTGTGTYTIDLDQPLEYVVSPALGNGQQQVHCQTDGPNFAAAQVQPDGSLLFTAYANGGLAADTAARIDVLVYKMPNKR